MDDQERSGGWTTRGATCHHPGAITGDHGPQREEAVTHNHGPLVRRDRAGFVTRKKMAPDVLGAKGKTYAAIGSLAALGVRGARGTVPSTVTFPPRARWRRW